MEGGGSYWGPGHRLLPYIYMYIYIHSLADRCSSKRPALTSYVYSQKELLVADIKLMLPTYNFATLAVVLRLDLSTLGPRKSDRPSQDTRTDTRNHPIRPHVDPILSTIAESRE
jgi:hypothetical protein